MEKHAYAFIGWTGQEIERFEIPWDKELPSVDSVCLKGPAVENDKNRYLEAFRGIAPGDVTEISADNGVLKVSVVPVTTRVGLSLVAGDTVIPLDEFVIHTRTADDKFAYREEGNVLYRLYTPDASGPRPLILFLHGGGNGGYEGQRDNNKQIITDYGPVNFAEKYPDIYVMAPMAVEVRRDMSTFNPNIRFAESDSMNVPGYGWCRDYLGQVCDIIRRMVDEGKVDGKRIYVTGMSMGGAGTIRAMSVGSDLFAACLPVCPSMSPETFTILKSIRRPVWVASAYIDHTLYRHKYLVDAVMYLRDTGNSNAHLTLFSPEDLEKYDVAVTPDLPYPRLFSENHASWIPAYCNEYGIMSWLLNQTKDD
ncbi:MAG: prolyl oligopeptidase family serine peptidase [Clostridia bacterium]|nr:prolyl oligopeptidase family serine peptidase [Clostridia bacterium]